jgi:predicted nucleic acid-binding protein
LASAAPSALTVERKRLVVDANILIRGCLGVRVRTLIANYADRVDFFVAEANLAEAADYIADLANEKNLDEAVCTEALISLMRIVQLVENRVLESARDEALARIRDADDWPALALGLQLECAIWTEDKDFFGNGIATWTTRTVERYLDS